MAISSTVFQIEYVGNASAATPYQIPFEFLAETDIVVEVLALGEEDAEELGSGDFTVTRNSVTRLGALVTDDAIPATSTVTIRRETPILQPAAFPAGGPFNTETLATALDRVIMIAQEISGGFGGGLVVPPDALRDAVRWEAGTDRPGVTPYRRGQLGIQMADNSLWMAESTTQGDWTAITAGGAGSTIQVFANSAARNTGTPASLGQLAVQLDTAAVYIGTALTVGSWQSIAQNAVTKTWANTAARATADPDFKGQIGIQLDDLSLWISDDLAPGDWVLFGRQQTNADPPSVEITGTEIDASKSRTFYKDLSANHAFTIVNWSDGMAFTCEFTNADTWTPTFPAGVVVDWDSSKGANIVTFVSIRGNLYSSTVARDPS